MPTGYEVQMYRDIHTIADALHSIEKKLPQPAETSVVEERDRAVKALNDIFEILWPESNPNVEWSADEIEWVAGVINDYFGDRLRLLRERFRTDA